MAEQEGINPWGSKSWTYLSSLRQQSPLIQCITNLVSMDLMANTLLAAGASPAMVHSVREIPEFTPHTQAVLINVGTLTPDWLPAMKAAAGVANVYGKPWVLDPAAVGASSFRLNACLELIELQPTVIRGNGSEIISLSTASIGSTKGADSLHESSDAADAAKALAKSSGSIVAVSGSVDMVTDGERVVGACNGVPMMQKITASGCAVTALIAAFVALDPANAFEATAAALSVFGLAGEIGMGMANGPASLRMHLIDSLHGLDEESVVHGVNIPSIS
ncbi:hydroxyethylthiazole kinase [Cynara cardunculus var. scolymus]|uniref:Hydroxyethylthiazole kinase n=1 Tax=Cynara cardunculus var. scolymus TaxID=59895 RepID=A0A103Y0L7_CYNCS|nr:hydroxyethylthiazole kinase [Cynara cardunculus var. scolymus]KVI00325.1 Hydroxyethylthiazole kinase [Cynara cardunculus var. scolymus]